jgi:hypothetical protein
VSVETPFERLGRELEQAAERQVAASAPASRRARGRGRTLVVVLAAVLLGAAAAAWAASALLSSGDPVPFERGAPVPGRAEGAPIPGTVQLLTDEVPDPDGGPPWGLRTWRTDRGYGCVQVGRVFAGRLGQITDGRVFHELRAGVTAGALGGCFVLDGSDHAFAAMHVDASAGGQPRRCPLGVAAGTMLKGRSGPVRCGGEDRTLDFGLLGPHAKSYVYQAGGRARTASPLGDVGAYLVVQRRLAPVMREFGFHHRDPRLNLRGPAEPELALTPASQVIRRVVYDAGACVVRVTPSLRGACERQAGYTPIPQPDVDDVRTPIRVYAAPGGRGIRVRFRAPQAVTDGRSGYAIEVRPVGLRAFAGQEYEHNVEAGAMVRTTVDLYNKHRGRYRIVVRYRTVAARPGPYARPAWPGLLVGQAEVTVP